MSAGQPSTTTSFPIPALSDYSAAWAWLSPKLAGRKVLAMQGELGAGKTTFVKTIVGALGGDASDVTSPTFSIVQEYDTPAGSVFHFDLYRLNSIDEVLDIDFESYLDSGAFIAVEWPAVAREILPKEEALWIELEATSTGGRKLLVLQM